MAKPLVAIKANNTVIGFGNIQKDDGLAVQNGGLGLNYITSNNILLGNNSSTLNTLGLSVLNSSTNISVSINNNSILGTIPIKLEVEEQEIDIQQLDGILQFGRIGPSSAVVDTGISTGSESEFEEAADDFGSEEGERF